MPEPVLSPQLSSPPQVMLPTGFATSVAESLPIVVRRLAEALRPVKIVLFGSYAYGMPTPDSDVDLLIVLETDDAPAERYLAVSRLLRPRPFPVDILVKTPQEVTHALDAADRFMQEIISRGRVLYERQ